MTRKSETALVHILDDVLLLPAKALLRFFCAELEITTINSLMALSEEQLMNTTFTSSAGIQTTLSVATVNTIKSLRQWYHSQPLSGTDTWFNLTTNLAAENDGSLMDGGSNGGLASSKDTEWLAVTHDTANVNGVTPGTLDDLPIGTAVAMTRTADGEEALLIMHQYAFHEHGKTIHSKTQWSAYGADIDDRSRRAKIPGEQSITTNCGAQLNLAIRNGLPMLDIWKPTPDQMVNPKLRIIEVTADTRYDTTALDCEPGETVARTVNEVQRKIEVQPDEVVAHLDDMGFTANTPTAIKALKYGDGELNRAVELVVCGAITTATKMPDTDAVDDGHGRCPRYQRR